MTDLAAARALADAVEIVDPPCARMIRGRSRTKLKICDPPRGM